VLKDPRLSIDVEYQVPNVFHYNIQARDPDTIQFAKDHGMLLTMDNGGRPFLVTMHSTCLRVYSKHVGTIWDTSYLLEYGRHNLDGLVLMNEIPLSITDTVFIGDGLYEDHAHYPEFVGNSILVARQSCVNTLISISVDVFTTTEPIIDFKSTVCNSNVVYGFALTQNKLVSMGPIGCFGYYETPRDSSQYDDSSSMVCRSGMIWSRKDLAHDVIVPRM